MRRIEILFLVLAIVLTVFLHACYMSGLYYDQDVALYAGRTLEILKGKSWQSSSFWINKPPGINLIFLLAFWLFGESFISIQVLALIAKVLSVILLYFFAKRLLAQEAKLYFLLPLFYALFSSSEVLQTNTSNCETFLVPLEVAGLFFLGLTVQKNKDIFTLFSGLMLGLAFFIKQSALAACLSGLAFIFFLKITRSESFLSFLKKGILFIGSFSIPLVILLIASFRAGVSRRLIDSLWLRNLEYIKNASLLKKIYMPWGMQQIWGGLRVEILIFGVLVLIGLIGSLRKHREPVRFLALSWFVITSSVIAVAGFHLRHHFIEILAPVLTLSVLGLSRAYALGVSRLGNRLTMALTLLLMAYPFLHSVIPLVVRHKPGKSFLLTQRCLLSTDKTKCARWIKDESYDAGRRFLMAQYVKERTGANEKIFVWDGLAIGSLLLWTGRDSVLPETKFSFLSDRLRGPFKIYLPRNSFYRLRQSVLMARLTQKPPVYIIVVQSVVPMPRADYSYEQVLLEEEKDFPRFFEFIRTHYHLEKAADGCFAYRWSELNPK
jgi:hypothetical protein